MTNYHRGSRFELKVKKHLEDYAWLVVKSGGSRGKADLVAIEPGVHGSPKVVLIQCKRDGRISALERIEFIKKALAYNCVPVLAYKGVNGIEYLELFDGPPMPWHPGGDI